MKPRSSIFKKSAAWYVKASNIDQRHEGKRSEYELWTYFPLFCSFSIADFEQANVSWVTGMQQHLL